MIEIAAERIPFLYYGVQAYDCPVCRAAEYKDNAYRERVRRNSLPEFLPKGHPDNPHDFDECGARVILSVLKARMDTEALRNDGKNNRNDVLPRVSLDRVTYPSKMLSRFRTR